MSIYIFTKKEESLKKFFPKAAQFPVWEMLAKHAPEDGSISYIDISSFAEADLRKTLTLIKNNCRDTAWGIIDPKGSVKDTAALFFEGASDYLPPALLKDTESIDPKRIKNAIQWRKEFHKSTISENKNTEAAQAAHAAHTTQPASAVQVAHTAQETQETGFLNSNIKLPSANVFPGWGKMHTGKVMSFYLLYCSFHGKISLDDRFDEKTVAQIQRRFLTCLENNFMEGDGLLWMNSASYCLFLIPPKVKCINETVKSCIRMLIGTPLVTLESLSIKIPANFIFALHYGSLNYNPPGKTGTIVSDAVNFIYHLGAKKAESGRLTVSDELPDVSIQKNLQNCFVPAGEFEGRRIWHTKKFIYPKPWL